MPEADKDITSAVDLSASAGMDSMFVYNNLDEFRTYDPTGIDEAALEPEKPKPKAKAKPERPLSAIRSEFTIDDSESFYQKVFGDDLYNYLPLGYQQMNSTKRAFFRGNAIIRNLATRTIGRSLHTIGAIDIRDQQSMQEFDGLRSSWELSELKKIRSKRDLTADEQAKFEVLKESATRWYQKGPEFTGVVGTYAVAGAMVNQLLAATGIGAALDAAGTKALAKFLPKVIDKIASLEAMNAGYGLIGIAVQETPKLAVELFALGAIASEGEDRVESGAQMTLWLPLAFVGPAVSATGIKVKVPQPIVSLYEASVANVATAWSTAKRPFVKAAYQKDLYKAFERSYQLEYNKVVPEATAIQAKAVFKDLVNRTADAARKNADDIFSYADEAFAAQRAMRQIEQVAGAPEQFSDDIIAGMTKAVEEKTGLTVVRQPDRLYAILDSATQQEVAVDLKRKHLAKKLGELTFEQKKGRMIGRKTKLTVTEEAELKKTLKQLNNTAKESYKSGYNKATEQANVKLNAARQRLSLVRQGHKDQLERMATAREMVKEFIPKDQQKDFLTAITKTRTEGGLGKLADRIQRHVDVQRMKESVKSLRGTFKDLTKKYGSDLSKAPDNVRPLLQNLYKGVDISKMRDPQIVDDIASISNEYRKLAVNTTGALSETARRDIPETIFEQLAVLAKKTELSANDVQFVDDMVRLIAHHAETDHQIYVAGRWQAAANAIDDTAQRLKPRKTKQKALGEGKRTVKDVFGVESDHPATLITKIAGRDSELMKTFDDFLDGESIAAGVERTGIQLFHDYMKRNNLSYKTLDNLSSKVSVRLGKENFTLTRDELLSMATFIKDPYNFEHLLTTKGIRVRGKLITDDWLDDFFYAVSQLTDDELKIGESFFNANAYVAPLINDTSVKKDGIRVATDLINYPMHRDIKLSTGPSWLRPKVEAQSRMMPRTGGTAPIKFRSFTAEYMDNIQQAARYHGMSIPVRNLNTILGDEGLQRVVDSAGYSKELENLITLLSRTQGMYSDISVVEGLAGKRLSQYSASVLAGRMTTVGTQVSSVPAFYAEIPQKYFAPQLVTKKDVFEMESLSDMLWGRWNNRRMSIELGNISASSSVQRHLLKKSTITEKALTPLVWGDQQAIGQGWFAAQRMAKAMGHTGNDAKLKAVEILEKAVRLSQPSWNISTRSKFATDPGIFKRMTAMFRTAQEAQLNILKRANADFSRTGNVKKLLNDYGAVVQSVVLVSLWRNMFRKAKNDSISGLAGWMGVHIPEKDEDAALKTIKDTGKTGLSLMPYGQYLGEAIDVAASMFIDDYEYRSYSKDPISTFTDLSLRTAKETAFLLDKLQSGESVGTNRYGLPVDKKIEDIDPAEVAKKVLLPALKLTSLATGVVGAAPIDEWVYPSLRRSKYKAVRLVGELNVNNPVDTQRKMEKFLVEWHDLVKKESSKGLTREEANRVLEMQDTKSWIDDFANDEDTFFLPIIEQDLNRLYKGK